MSIAPMPTYVAKRGGCVARNLTNRVEPPAGLEVGRRYRPPMLAGRADFKDSVRSAARAITDLLPSCGSVFLRRALLGLGAFR